MPVVVRPNLLAGLIARLKTFSEVTAHVGSSPARIAPEIDDGWPMPTKAVRLRQTGGPRSDVQASILTGRVDVTCYGSTPLDASTLLDIVISALCPDQMGRSGWVQGALRVYDVTPEAGPISDREPDTRWPFAWQPILITYSGVPAS